jgi:hypothetical protein
VYFKRFPGVRPGILVLENPPVEDSRNIGHGNLSSYEHLPKDATCRHLTILCSPPQTRERFPKAGARRFIGRMDPCGKKRQGRKGGLWVVSCGKDVGWPVGSE